MKPCTNCQHRERAADESLCQVCKLNSEIARIEAQLERLPELRRKLVTILSEETDPSNPEALTCLRMSNMKGLLGSLLWSFDERYVSMKQRGHNGIPKDAVAEISTPPHGQAKDRIEWYYDLTGKLVGSLFVHE